MVKHGSWLLRTGLNTEHLLYYVIADICATGAATCQNDVEPAENNV